MVSFTDLPPELVLRTLSYLPLPSLLCFAQTSRCSLAFATASVHTLSLGIFPNRIASLIGRLFRVSAAPLCSNAESKYMEADPFYEYDDPYAVSVVMPPEITVTPALITKFQNDLASNVVSRHAAALRNLDLAIWSINASTAKALVECKNLRSLSLRLDHPYVRHRHIDRHFWDRAAREGSTVWNTFDGAWGKLETIRLEGAGITDWQLQKILEANPRVKEISVSNCQLLGKEFWAFIGKSWEGRTQLRVLRFQGSPNREVDSGVLGYVKNLTGLKCLSFQGCQHLQNDEVEQLNEEVWHIPALGKPQPPVSSTGPIEVDPAFTGAQELGLESALVPAQA